MTEAEIAQAADRVVETLQRTLRLLVVATVLLYVVLIAALALVYRDAATKRRELAAVTESTTSALCTLRADLQRRVTQGDAFLLEHPHGIPGVPVETFRTSLEGQRRTVHALSTLKCPAPELTP